MLERALVSLLSLTVAVSCKPKAASNEAPGVASVITTTAGAAPRAAVPIPPEPPPSQATKVAEVPALEAKLASDTHYQALWTPEYANVRFSSRRSPTSSPPV